MKLVECYERRVLPVKPCTKKERRMCSFCSGIIRFFSSLLVVLCCLFLAATVNAEIKLDTIKLPPGFRIEVYAQDIEGARSLAVGPEGIVFVGSRSPGKIYALIDTNMDYRVDEVVVVARGLNSPNGVAFRDGSLYVAEISRVIRFDDIGNRLKNPPAPVAVNETFPKERHHGWKFIRFGPDEKLYVPVGAPCNICEHEDPRYSTIMRMNADGTMLEIFASGVRNTVGFDWHPETNELWFTENGRDWMGDNQPPDELNRAPVKGMHFGFPYCHGGTIEDPKFGKKRSCREFTAPEINLGPHVAALGMRFYTGKMFPDEYRNQILIAEHGSWNRLVPIGYRISLVKMKGNKPLSYETFAEGWLGNFRAWGRPVDILVMPDGSLLISDDRADAVYRISYDQPPG